MKNTNQEKCPICKGSGKQKVSIVFFGSDEPTKEHMIECIGCNGKGVVTLRQKSMIEYERDMWCTCGHKKGSTYYDDNTHPEISKHHYRCNTCNKVTQIG